MQASLYGRSMGLNADGVRPGKGSIRSDLSEFPKPELGHGGFSGPSYLSGVVVPLWVFPGCHCLSGVSFGSFRFITSIHLIPEHLFLARGYHHVIHALGLPQGTPP